RLPVRQERAVLRDDRGRLVGGAVVDDDVLQVRVALEQDGADRRLDPARLVVGRRDEADPRPGLAVGHGVGQRGGGFGPRPARPPGRGRWKPINRRTMHRGSYCLSWLYSPAAAPARARAGAAGEETDHAGTGSTGATVRRVSSRMSSRS